MGYNVERRFNFFVKVPDSRIVLRSLLTLKCCSPGIDFLTSTVLEAGKSKIKVPAEIVSGESSLPGLQRPAFSLYPYLKQCYTAAQRR